MNILNKLSLLLFVVVFASCGGSRKVYESDTVSNEKKKKTKKSGVAITKYNKLLNGDDAEAKFNAAIAYYEKGKYTKCIDLLENVLPTYRGTAKAADAQYYYAMSNYNIGDYIVAGYQFKSFVKNFPYNAHTEYCAYMNAICYYHTSPVSSLEQTDTDLAVDAFEKFARLYPESQYMAECNQKLDELRAKLERKSYENAMLYYNMESYKSAIVAFENHIKDFPGTTHHEELRYLTIKANYLLAINSIDKKKPERFQAVINSYIKFVDVFPNGEYLKDAEKLYTEAKNRLEKFN